MYKDILKRIKAGQFTHILVSLELLSSKWFHYILTLPFFRLYISLIIINKCHLVANWDICCPTSRWNIRCPTGRQNICKRNIYKWNICKRNICKWNICRQNIRCLISKQNIYKQNIYKWNIYKRNICRWNIYKWNIRWLQRGQAAWVQAFSVGGRGGIVAFTVMIFF